MSPLSASIPPLPLDLASLLPSRWTRGPRISGTTVGDRVGATGGRARSGAGHLVTIGRVEPDRASDEPSDESLMLDFLDGRRDAFEELVRRYRVELHQFLFRFLNSSAAADDVFQEAFIQVFQSGHTFDAARRFRPWLFTIAANKARDWHRRHRLRGAMSLDAPIAADTESSLVDLLQGAGETPDAPSERREDAAIVKSLIDDLPESLREILLLAYFQKLSYAQIADALAIPLGTVKSRLHAAVAAFAARWHAREERAASRTPGSSTPPRSSGSGS